MKRTFYSLCLSLFILSCATSLAQDEKHENHYQALVPVETDEYTISFADVHSQMAFCTMKIKIENNTNDFLYLDPSKISFNFPDGKSFSPKGKKSIVVDPQSKKSKSIKVAEEGYNFHADKVEVTLEGFSLLPVDGEIQKDEVFQLPPKRNDFTIGEFGCSVKGNEQKTKETKTDYKCTYKGRNIGLVDPSKISVKAEGDIEYANENKKSKLKVMEPGDNLKFSTVFRIPGKILDMQFATLDVVWNDAFIVSSFEDLRHSHELNLELDDALTNEKNK